MLLFSPHCSPQLFFFLDREKVVPSFEGGGPSLTFSFREEGRIASCHKKFPSVRKKEGEDDDFFHFFLHSAFGKYGAGFFLLRVESSNYGTTLGFTVAFGAFIKCSQKKIEMKGNLGWRIVVFYVFRIFQVEF